MLAAWTRSRSSRPRSSRPSPARDGCRSSHRLFDGPCEVGRLAAELELARPVEEPVEDLQPSRAGEGLEDLGLELRGPVVPPAWKLMRICASVPWVTNSVPFGLPDSLSLGCIRVQWPMLSGQRTLSPHATPGPVSAGTSDVPDRRFVGRARRCPMGATSTEAEVGPHRQARPMARGSPASSTRTRQ